MNQDNFKLSSLLQQRRGLIGWFIFALFVLGVLYVLFSYSFYTFSVNGVVSSLQAEDENNKTSQVLNIFGLHFIPKSAVHVSISSGGSQTRIALVDKPFLGIKHEDVEVKKQYTTTKIGKGSLGCDSKSGSRYFTYSCSGATNNVLLYVNSNDPNKKFTNDPSSLTYQVGDVRYKDGLLRFKESENSKGVYVISYLNFASEAIVSDTLKLDLGDNAGSNFKIFPSNTNDGSFSIVGTNGNIYYFDSVGAESRLAKRKVPFEVSSDAYLCSVASKKVVCFYGAIDPRGSNEHELNNSKSSVDESGSKNSVEVYDFTTNKIISKKVGERYVDDICLVGNQIFLKRDTKLSRAVFEQNSITEKGVIIPDIKSIGCGDSLTYTTGSGIYTYINDRSYLAFYVSRVNIVSIHSLGKSVLFNGSISPDRTLHTYRLNLGSFVGEGVRIESKLPYSPEGAVLESDYDDNFIYVKLFTSFSSNHQTGKTTYDQKTFNESKAEVQKKLQEDGLTGKYQVRYFSYN